VKPPKKETITKMATAVLSTTAKVKAREKKKAAEDKDAMDTVSTAHFLPFSFSHYSILYRMKSRKKRRAM
jgi:hypothetical protein